MRILFSIGAMIVTCTSIAAAFPPNFSTGGTSNFSNTEGGFSGSGNPSAVTYPQQAPPYPAPNPSQGPQEPFIYENSDGKFKLSQGAAKGRAQYRWQGHDNDDALTFIAFGAVRDNTGIGIPQNSSVNIWLYEASDTTGNKWYLGFGVDRLNLSQVRYPLYYSYQDPRTTGNLARWLTSSGTSRF